MTVGSRVLRFSACLVLLGLVACDKGPSAPSSQAKPAASGMVASAMPTTTPSAKDFAPSTNLMPLHFAFDRSEVLAGDRAALDQRGSRRRGPRVSRHASTGELRTADVRDTRAVGRSRMTIDRLAHPALVVVDMQNDFVRIGAPLEVPEARPTIPVHQRLLAACRERSIPVIYTKFVAGPERTLVWEWSPVLAPPVCCCWKGFLRHYDD